MKTLALTALLAILTLPTLVFGDENTSDSKKPHGMKPTYPGPTNPNSDLSAKPKGPSKAIVNTQWDPKTGKMTSHTKCTGFVGQRNCPVAPQ